MTDDAAGQTGTYRRPRLSANGRREVVADAIFDLSSIAGALKSEQQQVLRIADPAPADDDMAVERRARFIAMELGFQREKLLAWITELGALAEQMDGVALPGQTTIPDDVGA